MTSCHNHPTGSGASAQCRAPAPFATPEAYFLAELLARKDDAGGEPSRPAPGRLAKRATLRALHAIAQRIRFARALHLPLPIE